MCGRFDKHTTNDWIARQCFGRALSGPESSPRYNVAPGTAIDAVTRVDTETVYISPMHWGFRPAWAGKDSPAPINARAETVAGSRYFAHAFSRKRCLVPADGWFEWQASDAGKVPYYITCAPDTDRILFMAGIWEYGAGDDPVCAIITEPAASSLAFIHSRQPVVLDPACLEQWLDPELVDREAIRQTVQRRDPESLRFWSVSSAVNRPGNDSPDLIEPVSPGT
jgi:putative SOS response-associated peptidase YedK